MQRNARLRDFTDLRAIFLTDWWQPQSAADEIELKQRDRLYRPLALFSLALNYAVHGLDPFGYHLANVLLHSIASAFVFAFAMRLANHRAIAWITGLSFAVHPVHVEAVANIVGRAEILACLGLLFGCLMLLPGASLPSPTRLAAAGLAFLAALLSKETAICYPVIAAILLWYRATQSASRWRIGRWLTAAALLLWPLALYFPLRYTALGGHVLRDRAPSDLLNALVLAEGWQRIWMSLEVLGHYARLLILPQKLSSSYGFAVLDPDRGPGLLSLIGAAALAGLVGAAFGIRSSVPLRRSIAIATGLFAASYILISNSILLIGVDVAERLFYWPSVPALLLIACVIAAALEKHAQQGKELARVAPMLRLVGFALLGALAIRTLVRNPDWADNRIFEIDAQTYPLSATLHVGTAKQRLLNYERFDPPVLRERAEQAEAAAARALAIQPHYVEALLARARAKALLGDRKTARELVDTALTLEATDIDARDLLRMLQELDATDDLPRLQAALASQPADVELREQVATALLRAGKFEEARQHIEQVVRATPDRAIAHRLLGDALMGLAEPDAARVEYLRAVDLAPNDWQAHSNLVGLLSEKDPAGALRHARTAHRLQPTEFTTISNLAQMLAHQDQWREALPLFEQLRAGLPADSPLRPVIEDRIRHARSKLR